MATLPSTTNLAPLAPITTTATSLSNLVVVTAQLASMLQSGPAYTQGYAPQNPPSANGLPNISLSSNPSILFHYEGEQTVSLESDITDHFVEDNTAIQDNIALRPIMITTHGFIGELNDVPPLALAALKQATNALTTIAGYTPSLSTTALIAYATAFQAYQVAANAAQAGVSAWDALSGSGGESVINGNGFVSQSDSLSQTQQQRVFQQFFGYWSNRTLFTVQTPWAVFQNMAIKTMRAIQDAETDVITDFEITFKSIRTVVSASDQTFLAGRSAIQAALANPLGSTTGTAGPSTSAANSQFGLSP